jgi:hypothetical protein
MHFDGNGRRVEPGQRAAVKNGERHGAQIGAAPPKL